MQSTQACKSESQSSTGGRPEPRDVSGIALFMVMAAISVLTILVTEFAYIAQINERMAFDSMDQVKAHYLAKAGLKLSLLRLKAYAQLKSTMGGGAGGGGSNPLAGAIPKVVLEKIWSFPFMYPVPALPEMSVSQKDQIDLFQKNSSLEGRYSAIIESESSRFNLNMILAQFVPTPSASPSPGGSAGPQPGAPTAGMPAPGASPSFNPDAARQSLHDYIQDLMQARFDTDDDFAREYRDFKLDDLITYIAMWADRSFITNVTYPRDEIQPKRAPFYSLSELHMIPTMDDDLYNLLAEGITVSATPGININTMQDPTLRALIPEMTKDEVAEFFKFRDDPTMDNSFKKAQDFWDYITKNVSAFRGDQNQVAQVQKGLQDRNISLVTDETQFKITVQATVNQAVKTIEAWVTLNGPGAIMPTVAASLAPAQAPPPNIPPLSGPGAQETPVPDSGLRINFMRVF